MMKNNEVDFRSLVCPQNTQLIYPQYQRKTRKWNKIKKYKLKIWKNLSDFFSSKMKSFFFDRIGNMKHILVASDTFVKVMKVKSHIGLLDAKLTWYSLDLPL